MKILLALAIFSLTTLATAGEPAWRTVDGEDIYGGLFVGTVQVDNITTPTVGTTYSVRLIDETTGGYLDTPLTMVSPNVGALIVDTGIRRDRNFRAWLLADSPTTTATATYPFAVLHSTDPIRYLSRLTSDQLVSAIGVAASRKNMTEAQTGEILDTLRDAGMIVYAAKSSATIAGASTIDAAVKSGIKVKPLKTPKPTPTPTPTPKPNKTPKP